MNKLLVLIFLNLAIIVSFSIKAEAKDNNSGLFLSKEKTSLLYKAQEYLSSIKTAKGKFLQTNPDELPISDGEIYISKPGKMVLKYTRPYQIYYYIIDDNFLQYDADLDQVTRASAPENPLRVLLYNDIKFYDNNIMDVGGVTETSEDFSVFLATKDKDYTEISGLILTFTKSPISLVEIKRVDAEGNITNLKIAGLRINEPLDKSVFEFSQPKTKYPGSRR